MDKYLCIDAPDYFFQSLTDYQNLKAATKNFTDFSSFIRINDGSIDIPIDKSARIIINDKCYEILKSYTNLDCRKQFIVVR